MGFEDEVSTTKENDAGDDYDMHYDMDEVYSCKYEEDIEENYDAFDNDDKICVDSFEDPKWETVMAMEMDGAVADVRFNSSCCCTHYINPVYILYLTVFFHIAAY